MIAGTQSRGVAHSLDGLASSTTVRSATPVSSGGLEPIGVRESGSVLSSQNIAPASVGLAKSIHVGKDPTQLTYDPGRGEVFIANSGSDSASVISDRNNTVADTLSLGSSTGPVAVAYDSTMGEVFVLKEAGNVSVINDSTDSIVATLKVGSDPVGIAYDSENGDVFVTNCGSATVSVISDLTDKVIATMSGAKCPEGIVYDSSQNRVFVAESGHDSVVVFNTSKPA